MVTKKTTSKKRLSATIRRPLVKMYLQTEGWGPTEIARQISSDKKIDVARQTVSEDIKDFTAENDMWSHYQAMVGWMSTVRSQHKSLLTEIQYLETKLATHRAVESDGGDPETPGYLKVHEYLAVLKGLNNTINALDELIERNILYQKTAEYARFYETHQKKELQ